MTSGGLAQPRPSRPADAHAEERIRWSVRRRACDPAAIAVRLAQLDREWDLDRVIGAGAGLLTLAGLAMGRLVTRRWYLLPAVAQGLLLQHALRGSSLPARTLRLVGVRTRLEIERERYALKAVRGDFTTVRPRHAEAALDATA